MEKEVKKINPKMVFAIVLSVIGAAIQLAHSIYISIDRFGLLSDYERLQGDHFFSPGNYFWVFIEMIPVALLIIAAVIGTTKKNNYNTMAMPCFGFGILYLIKSLGSLNIIGISLGVLLFICGITIGGKKPVKPLIFVTYVVSIIRIIFMLPTIGSARHQMALVGSTGFYSVAVSFPVDFISSFLFACAWLLVVTDFKKPEEKEKKKTKNKKKSKKKRKKR